jgi:hypothetical protein
MKQCRWPTASLGELFVGMKWTEMQEDFSWEDCCNKSPYLVITGTRGRIMNPVIEPGILLPTAQHELVWSMLNLEYRAELQRLLGISLSCYRTDAEIAIVMAQRGTERGVNLIQEDLGLRETGLHYLLYQS